MRLYIVCSVKKDTDFETKTRKEISVSSRRMTASRLHTL